MEETTTQNTAAEASSAKTATLKSGRGGIMGIKAGMTQVYGADGQSLAVTVVEIKTNTITQVKKQAKEGYSAIQIGILPKKESRLNSAEKGHFKKSGVVGFYHTKEIRVADDKAIEGMTEGQTLTAEFLKDGDLVDVQAVSKGKGFQGVMKKYHYAGGHKTHGASVSHRSIGSIGNRADPGKVFKGKKMAGHMGHAKVSILNVKVVKVDLEKGIILLHGSVPGPKSGIVTIRKAVKV
ncbi:MAG: 50S ribosomal protein L3 [Bdellovibrionales bacterium]|nr:50S ribosomal protein L3 [Bdellovibrionales bacterium]